MCDKKCDNCYNKTATQIMEQNTRLTIDKCYYKEKCDRNCDDTNCRYFIKRKEAKRLYLKLQKYENTEMILTEIVVFQEKNEELRKRLENAIELPKEWWNKMVKYNNMALQEYTKELDIEFGIIKQDLFDKVRELATKKQKGI